MPWNLFLQDNNTSYESGDYGRTTSLATIIKIASVVLISLGIFALAAYFLLPNNRGKNTESATTAARKVTPNANVSNVKVAGGFAIAIVSDPTANSQANAGNMTIFKVNKDGSMKQIASGSSFSPIDMLELGIPLMTQAKLTGNNVNQVEQNLADACGYNGGNTPGYNGFDGSFNPDGWQIDSATLNNLEQALTTVVSNENTTAGTDKKIVCVNATRNNSDATTNMETYISTFSLDIQFITSSGVMTTHKFTFATGPSYYRSYTLDGKVLPNS